MYLIIIWPDANALVGIIGMGFSWWGKSVFLWKNIYSLFCRNLGSSTRSLWILCEQPAKVLAIMHGKAAVERIFALVSTNLVVKRLPVWASPGVRVVTLSCLLNPQGPIWFRPYAEGIRWCKRPPPPAG